MNHEMMTVLQQEFEEGRALTAVYYEGEPCVLASEFGAMLGYGNDGTRLGKMISKEWADDFEEGKHFAVVRGKSLKDLKELVELSTYDVPCSPIGKNARHVTLLTLAGINKVLLKTEKPIGVKIRDWLVEDVFPALREHGRYSLPDAEPEPDRPKSLAELREERLQRAERRKAVAELAASLRRLEVSEREIDVIVAKTNADAIGIDITKLLPSTADDWLSPTQIAEMYGVTAARVGLTISKLGLRGNKEGLARAVSNKSQHSARSVVSYLYSRRAVKMIEADLRDGGHLPNVRALPPAT